jgi:hypothetical protein
MSTDYTPKIRDLKRNIETELSRLGIEDIEIYMSDSSRPSVHYKVKKDLGSKFCQGLKESLRKKLMSNIPEIKNVTWYIDSHSNEHVIGFIMQEGYKLSENLRLQHNIYSLVHKEILEQKQRC